MEAAPSHQTKSDVNQRCSFRKHASDAHRQIEYPTSNCPPENDKGVVCKSPHDHQDIKPLEE
jgi:hypothetical protein